MSETPTQPVRPPFTRSDGAATASDDGDGGTPTHAGVSFGRPAGGRLRQASSWLRSIPRAAWVCTLIALLNAATWSLITPPFQGKDEVDHFAYVAHLAETGTLPTGLSRENEYSPKQLLTMEGLRYYQVRFTASAPSLSSDAEQRELTRDAETPASERGQEGAGIATPEPPLYYALQTIPYLVARGNVLAQLQLMRLFGVLLAASTALLSFLFLRELLPGVPWAATVGAICVAVQPLLGFMSGSVNPDSMLYTVVAAIFLCLARGFKRGFTRRLALALGLLIVVGFATKLNFVGVALGVFLGVAALGLREARAHSGRALASSAIAGGLGLTPIALYAVRNAETGRPTLGAVSGLAGSLSSHSLGSELSYMWELFLPRLPGMTHYFVGLSTFKDIWFDRSVGLYGWMDTLFPGWVDNVALVLAAVVALLCGRELVRRRDALRTRLIELGVYAAMAGGILVMLGVASYHSDALDHELAFGEPRYLLPMLPLLGAVVTLAARGAGRRWAPATGAALVIVFLGHDIFSQLQVIARYYG